MFMAIEPKKRGRPPMSPEKKAEVQARRTASQNEHHKSTGWAAQKNIEASTAVKDMKPKLLCQPSIAMRLRRCWSKTE